MARTHHRTFCHCSARHLRSPVTGPIAVGCLLCCERTSAPHQYTTPPKLSLAATRRATHNRVLSGARLHQPPHLAAPDHVGSHRPVCCPALRAAPVPVHLQSGSGGTGTCDVTGTTVRCGRVMWLGEYSCATGVHPLRHRPTHHGQTRGWADPGSRRAGRTLGMCVFSVVSLCLCVSLCVYVCTQSITARVV